MKFIIEHPTENAVTLFRRSGYTFQREDRGEISFVRPLAQAGFPRFHCYVKTIDGAFHCNLHLDQKKETYGRETRHHGEYTDEGALSEEKKHLENTLGTLTVLV